ncbi:uncharacterized protein [Pyxicephalus adspersus]|uniref:uncharacterized protein isoform X1 n=1 Tax=Pyxicephalus adspersus TaxID=30357 RepID=UPI003B590887
MTSYINNSSIFKPQQDFPKGHRAGHFEHVAQMNMFEDISTFLQIPPKIRLVKVPAEEDSEPPVGTYDRMMLKILVNALQFGRLGDKNFKVLDPADSASSNNDDCFKLFNLVRRDLQLSDSDDCKSENTAKFSSKKTRNIEKEDNQKRMMTEEVPNNEDEEWARARQRVEEFLDFPAVISAMNLRNKAESMFSQMSCTSTSQKTTWKEAVSIPNTRHNAIFLRDNPKAAQVILMSQYDNSANGRPEIKTEHKQDLKGDGQLEKDFNLAEKPNTDMEPEIESDR